MAYGLGQIVRDYPTSAEAIKHAGLNYTVEKRPLFTYDNENNTADEDTDIKIPEIDVPDFFATMHYRYRTGLGVVGRIMK